MRVYADEMRDLGKVVKYVEFGAKLAPVVAQYKEVAMYDPMDFDIVRDVRKIVGADCALIEAGMFVLNSDEVAKYIADNKKLPINYNFYKWIRVYKNILVSAAGKPAGGKWSYDSENRRPFPKSKMDGFCEIKLYSNDYTKEAAQYVNKHFAKNPGEINFYLPIDKKGANRWLREFITHRLPKFGLYEDAMSNDAIIGFHSAISAMLNNGLLTPSAAIEAALKSSAPLASREGFIRQILSWREYVRIMYVAHHKTFNKMNFLKHTKKIPKSWYTASTGIAPVDDCVRKALKYAYCHHIERLMVLGNFALIYMAAPKAVYKWFMELVCIDAYEWVMEPNVYGMSQHSVGKLMMTRPYFSSSNYITKMSTSYRKSAPWKIKFDTMYYNFIGKHAKYLKTIYATAPAVAAYNRRNMILKKRNV